MGKDGAELNFKYSTVVRGLRGVCCDHINPSCGGMHGSADIPFAIQDLDELSLHFEDLTLGVSET